MARRKYPPANTPVCVYWEDIFEDPAGNPAAAEPHKRKSYGVFLGVKKREGRMCVVTTTTLEGWDNPKSEEYSGWCSYPIGAVHKIVPMTERNTADELPRPLPRVRGSSEDKTS